MQNYRRPVRPGSYKTWSEHLEARLDMLAELFEAMEEEGWGSTELGFIQESIQDMLDWRKDEPFLDQRAA